ncbi:RCC1/BLIP-II [Abortiporus biennis]|nr:RCC1/BLIP-II [Abortiporus biennis]
MLRGSTQVLRSSTRAAQKRLVSQVSSSTSSGRNTASRHVILAASATVAATALWYNLDNTTLHNDAPKPDVQSKISTRSTIGGDGGQLETTVWGSNKSHLLSPGEQSNDTYRVPTDVEWLHNIALRDLVLHEKHAACIDAKGDVYQWGDGYYGRSESASQPNLTLKGKNIVKLQATPSRVFALSASGRIYALSSSSAKQELPAGVPTPSSDSWWGTGWMWGEEENVDFAEITPSEKLGWNEKFVKISAGNDHLLALTSSGRTFAHPINLHANSHGQLGFRKFDIPDHSTPLNHSRRTIELIPKFVKDPYAKSTPAIRKVSSSESSESTISTQQDDKLDDSNIHFSDKLFEVPALKEVKADSIVTGSRSSFVKTPNGKVLGWGANEFGQIGLGGNVSLDSITVPTEVILWRSTPLATRTTCLDIFAGGDLTFFKVERSDGTAMPYIDVLACGNGQYGGLGNAQFTNAQGSPVKAKNVSGLFEYSESTNNLQAIHTHDISISPTGHVLLTLDTMSLQGPGGQGRDLVVWGANQDYQLGIGKRGSIATPTALQLPVGPDSEEKRFILGRRKASEVRDLSGKVWKKGVEVEQRAVAGFGNSVVYWRIAS